MMYKFMKKQRYLLKLNQRVKISNAIFKEEVCGTIIAVPRETKQMFKENWQNDYLREIETKKGNHIFYWVKLDIPQFDRDGDGPYHEAEVNSMYLTPI